MVKTVEKAADVIRGEFFTDGESFVFRLGGTPISGTGDSAQAAFDDLVRTQAAAGALTDRLKELAREQAGEKVRATVISWSMGALIAFGVVGGALAGGLALAPMAIAGVVDSSTARLETWVENLPPATEQKLSRLMHGEKDCAGGAAVPLAPRPDR